MFAVAMELSGRVAIVTGGGSGMGRSFSILFAKEGARVVVVDIVEKSGTETVTLIEKAGGQALFVLADLTKAEDAKQVVRKTIDAYGRLDTLVNNAGILHMGTVVQTTEADWDAILATNLKSMFLMSKCAVPEIAKNGGTIINMASDAGLIGNPDSAAYCASKGGVISLTRAMALDHAAEGIRVNCICPGAIDTPLLKKGFDELSQEQRDAWRARVKERYPLGRIGKPEEVAQVALFLASDGSSFMTGAAVSVDGGLTIK